MNKLFIIIPIVLLVIVGVVGAYFVLNKEKLVNNSGNTNVIVTNHTPIVVTKENLPSYIASQQVIKDLPAKGVISLRFYNFNSGEREWENSYIITKNMVVDGTAENVDVELTMASSYIPEFKNGFCETIIKAKANNDLGINVLKSQTEIAWKYKNMLEYKACLGL